MNDSQSQSGIPLKSVYGKKDIEAGTNSDNSLPGEYPYTRGRRIETGEKAWIHQELSGEGSPRRSN